MEMLNILSIAGCFRFCRKHSEIIFWMISLLALAVADPAGKHYKICILNLAGISWCPGCGIGHSISYLLHGNPAASLDAHWLGIPALIIIMERIFSILYQNYYFKKHFPKTL